MQITMVKKRLPSGEPCGKCLQAETFLQNRGLYERIDRVVWADERDAASEGMRLASAHGVELAPFFIVENGGRPRVVTSVLELVKKVLAPPGVAEPGPVAARSGDDLEPWLSRAANVPEHDAEALVRLALERFGKECAIAFSGAEDVALIELAAKTGLPYSVMTLDTGRLNPETYRFFDEVRQKYSVDFDVLFPDPAEVERLVREKGFFSFYKDGHKECCTIRKVRPLARGLRRYRAWMTGQRRDQSPTRTEVSRAELDSAHEGLGGPLVKLNPLAAWSGAEVWSFLRERGVPTNELHRRGQVSIGCEPCTRPVLPHEHERAGRWWWEDATQRECGLHVVRLTREG